MNETPSNDSSAPGPSRNDPLDSILHAFESAWKAGQRPRIEPFLEQSQSLDRDELLRELILLEIDRLNLAGEESPSAESYLRRFPDHADAVRSAFELLESRLRHEASTVDQLDSSDGHAPLGENPQPVPADEDEKLPDQIGRFQIRRLLGKGGFARVYLAYDTDLDVMRALKVPRRDRFQDVQQMESFVQEARTAARLEHDGIVRVYDVQRADQQVCIVQQYVEGESLADTIRRERLAPHRVAELLIQVAEAIGYAHRHGFVHRDLKPANILLDAKGQARVADFGLALDERQQRERVGELAGSLLYMSPEQTRRESHRLDGRSDIWSLGVILYELLTGTRPFGGQTRSQIFDEIQNRDPRPPRMLDPTVPRDLSRICLTCLAKRATDRYETAADLVEDLKLWLDGLSAPERTTPASPGDFSESDRAVRIVPKGLASYDAEDADFFLELLPGPHDRDGLPRSIRFWKSRIEQTDPEKSFRVGLIYGASGCGKSSLVKAGLMPRLDDHVLPIYVEAKSADTEVRLLKGLRGACPHLSPDAALPEMFRKLREERGARGRKVLVVLDQFEQWLHAGHANDASQLLEALRQCDGTGVQCLVMVRDDFTAAVHRFFEEIEVTLDAERNFAVVSRFDLQHAAKVLGVFGVAYGRLSDDASQWTNEQQRFISAAVNGLAEEHEVISVRLAVFAEMMSNRSWTEASLRDVGGTERVGVNYLEETFSAKSANPKHRVHENAVRALLKALLPPEGTYLKGQMQSYDSLKGACGYDLRPDDFDQLLRILDHDVRIITPTEPDAAIASASDPTSRPEGGRFYQLTHDYLVPSLREWITQSEQKTFRGRTLLLLAKRSNRWAVNPEPRQLPSFLEWLRIACFADRRVRTPVQKKCMREATVRHLVQLIIFVPIVVLVPLAAWFLYFDQWADQKVDSLLTANISEVDKIIRPMRPHLARFVPRLEQALTEYEQKPDKQLLIQLALFELEGTRSSELIESLMASSTEWSHVICTSLAGRPAMISEPLREHTWEVLEDMSERPSRRIRAASLLARIDHRNDRWQNISTDLVDMLIGLDTVEVRFWADQLNSVTELRQAAHEVRRTEPMMDRRYSATVLLVAWHSSDPHSLGALVHDADSIQLKLITKALAECDPAAVRSLRQQWVANEARFDTNHILALLLLGDSQSAWQILSKVSESEHVTLEARTLAAVAPSGLRPNACLISLLGQSTTVLNNPRVLRTLLLMLAEFDVQAIRPDERDQTQQVLLDIYESHAHGEVHAAALRLASRWGWTAEAADRRLKVAKISLNDQLNARNWIVGSTGHALLVVDAPGPVEIGSEDYPTIAPVRKRLINRRYALGICEVTGEEYHSLVRAAAGDLTASTDPLLPKTRISWFDAARFCNLLSELEGLDPAEWCFGPDHSAIGPGMSLPADFLDRSGYRLPTEAEWEYACRSKCSKGTFHGDIQELLGRYAWFRDNATDQRLRPVGLLLPNPRGLYDILGNAAEWCLSPFEPNPVTALVSDAPESLQIKPLPMRVIRGGAFTSPAPSVNPSYRGLQQPTNADAVSVGFRLARTLPVPGAKRNDG